MNYNDEQNWPKDWKDMLKLLFLVIFGALIFFVIRADSQILIYEENTNYLTYNNKPLVLIGATNTGHNFHVQDFELTFIDTLVKYNCNHTWIMLDNYYVEKWVDVSNTAVNQIEFWDKLEKISKKCYENDILLGINIFGYGIVKDKSKCSFSFNACCDCNGSRGPLTEPWDFFRMTNNKVNEAQKCIINELLNRTWKYPNVYYFPCWESAAIWDDDGNTMYEWTKWVNTFIKKQGKKIDSTLTHLIAIEKSCSKEEMFDLDADFIIDEDGNAFKTDNVPFVYWSMDGIYRDTPVWNGADEPRHNIEWMEEELFNNIAGISSIWGAQQVEKDNLFELSQISKTFFESQFISYQDSQIIIKNFNKPYLFEKNNSQYYLDRDYQLEWVEFNHIYLRTRNNDKDIIKKEFLSFNISENCIIYLYYDSRLPLPSWFNDFKSFPLITAVDNQGIIFNLYYKEFKAGEITLGSNKETEFNGGSMYFLSILPQKDTIAPAKPKIIGVN